MIGMARGTKATSVLSWPDTRDTGHRRPEDEGEKVEADAHENNATDNPHHAQRHAKNPQDKLAKEEKEKRQQRGIETGQAGHLALFRCVLSLAVLEKPAALERIDDRQERREHADK
jgi:hypothetical protein